MRNNTARTSDSLSKKFSYKRGGAAGEISTGFNKEAFGGIAHVMIESLWEEDVDLTAVDLPSADDVVFEKATMLKLKNLVLISLTFL